MLEREKTSAPTAIRRVRIRDVPVDCIDFDEAVRHTRDLVRTGKRSTILAVNAEKVYRCQTDAVLRSAIENAALLLPDGIGAVIAARLLHRAEIARVPGCDLMPALCGMAAEENYGVFLFGGAPGIAERAAAKLLSLHPRLQVVGFQHGFLDEGAMDGLIDRINEAKPHMLFIAMGSPRQEIWMKRYLPRLSVNICQGVGGTFDVLAGEVRRAPKAFQSLQLEWLYRLLRQPMRLRRQVVYPVFVGWILRDLFMRPKTGKAQPTPIREERRTSSEADL